MEVILDEYADMASFFTPFRKAHCMNSGLRTPPSSPDSNGSSKRAGPRLRLSKFLQKGEKHSPGRSRCATNGATPPGSCVKRGSKSPFRAVTEMKEPFPLMLPDSPALTDETSHDQEKQRLRRVSASYLDLRAIAQIQSGLSTSRLNTPLLPSPMLMPGEDKSEANSYFACFPKRRDTPPPEEAGDDAPYEIHRIISGYCKKERWSLLLDEVRQSKQASQLRHASSAWSQARKTAPSSPQPLTPSPKPRKRDRTYSTESDWLANTMSHEERVRRFKQRYFQVVQHPARKNAPAHIEDEDQIMLATVLIGPGKPKLVQIQRPPSSTSRSSQARSSRTEATKEEDCNSPLTPAQAKNEVSAFSPYDTPCQRAYGSMNPMMQLVNSSDSAQEQQPAPVSITPRSTHYRIDSAVYVHEDKDPFNPHETLPSYISSMIWPVPLRDTCDTTLHTRKFEAALDQITAAINAFPSSLLHLDSPMVRQLRNTSVASHAYVSPLQKIFPAANTLLLSAMGAWCLVDSYLSSVELFQDERARYDDILAASNDCLHQIPVKARRMLGIRSPQQMSRDDHERSLRQRAQFVRISAGVIAQRLMEAVKGGWVEELWRATGVLVQMVDTGGYCHDEEEEEWV